MINKVLFVGRNTAETCGPFQDWALISIGEPAATDGPPKLKDGWHSILKLEFHDIDTDVNTAPDGPFVLMSEDDAKRIVDFVTVTAPEVDVILVHCRAGISRSAAVAKWIARRYRLPFDHKYAHWNRYVMRCLEEAEHGLK